MKKKFKKKNQIITRNYIIIIKITLFFKGAMTKTTSELANFIIDLEDEECPNFGLHLAAYQGDIPQLLEFLKDPEYKDNIDARIRPFLASPLRLAATG